MKQIIYFSTIMTFILADNSYAYLDPNSGGGLLAFLAAIVAGIAFYFKKIFYGIKSVFTGKKYEDKSSNSDSEQNKDNKSE